MKLVLKGSYHVAYDYYCSGMLEIAYNHTTNYVPLIDPAEDCICSVVAEAPIAFHSRIS